MKWARTEVVRAHFAIMIPNVMSKPAFIAFAILCSTACVAEAQEPADSSADSAKVRLPPVTVRATRSTQSVACYNPPTTTGLMKLRVCELHRAVDSGYPGRDNGAARVLLEGHNQ